MWPFKRKPKPSHIEVMFPFVRRMKAKDPELFSRIGHMPVGLAAAEWRKKYPNDLPPLKPPYVE